MFNYCELERALTCSKLNDDRSATVLAVLRNGPVPIDCVKEHIGIPECEEIIWQMIDEGILKVSTDWKVETASINKLQLQKA